MKVWGVFLVLCVAFLGACSLFSPRPLQRIVVVATSGADGNPGTIDRPFASLAAALRVARPGTQILVRGGIYPVAEAIRIRGSGSPNRPIEIFAFPGEKPILDGRRMRAGYWDGWVIDVADASWIHLKGIEVINGPMGGVVIRGQSHHNIIEGLDVHHNGWLSEHEGKGISLYGPASFNVLLNNFSHHNRDLGGDNADGFQVNVSGRGNVLCGNRAWRNSDDGFDFFNNNNTPHTAMVTVEYNYAWENGFDERFVPLGDGIGFKLGGAREGSGASSGGHVVRNNWAWANRGGAFDRNGATMPSITVANHSAAARMHSCPVRFGPP